MFKYRPLWKLLIDHNMNKNDLREKVGLAPSTVAKMGKDQNVSMDIVDKLCNFFKVQPNDIIEHVIDEQESQQSGEISE